ncbi:hypothetical protein DPSP01_007320 [Paraphaeosphaeria sporulosa]
MSGTCPTEQQVSQILMMTALLRGAKTHSACTVVAHAHIKHSTPHARVHRSRQDIQPVRLLTTTTETHCRFVPAAQPHPRAQHSACRSLSATLSPVQSTPTSLGS